MESGTWPRAITSIYWLVFTFANHGWVGLMTKKASPSETMERPGGRWSGFKLDFACDMKTMSHKKNWVVEATNVVTFIWRIRYRIGCVVDGRLVAGAQLLYNIDRLLCFYVVIYWCLPSERVISFLISCAVDVRSVFNVRHAWRSSKAEPTRRRQTKINRKKYEQENPNVGYEIYLDIRSSSKTIAFNGTTLRRTRILEWKQPLMFYYI